MPALQDAIGRRNTLFRGRSGRSATDRVCGRGRSLPIQPGRRVTWAAVDADRGLKWPEARIPVQPWLCHAAQSRSTEERLAAAEQADAARTEAERARARSHEEFAAAREAQAERLAREAAEPEVAQERSRAEQERARAAEDALRAGAHEARAERFGRDAGAPADPVADDERRAAAAR
jgi:hypothetical protein